MKQKGFALSTKVWRQQLQRWIFPILPGNKIEVPREWTESLLRLQQVSRLERRLLGRQEREAIRIYSAPALREAVRPELRDNERRELLGYPSETSSWGETTSLFEPYSPQVNWIEFPIAKLAGKLRTGQFELSAEHSSSKHAPRAVFAPPSKACLARLARATPIALLQQVRQALR